MLLLAGCVLTPAAPPSPPPAAPTAVPWRQADDVMAGVCFEAALDAAGQVYVLPDAAALSRFYDLVDASQLCPRPVERRAFDFSGGRVLAGLWSAGVGCTARHELLAFERNDAARTLTLRLRLVIEGDCPYELVRPFWAALEAAAGYDIRIQVE